MKRFLKAATLVALIALPSAEIFAHSYSPIQISIVPGLGLPFGVPDAAIAVGSVGNISGRIDLIQAAGVFNIAEDLRGIQAAGVFNIASRNMEGAQLAGVFNIADGNRSPVQAGGVFNIADGVQGIQVGGVFNIAGEVQGAQVSPVFNVAKDVRGFQVGLVNVADEMRGVQIGLVNISSNGVFELSGAWEPQTELARATVKSGNTSIFGVYSVAAPKDTLFRSLENSIVSVGLGTRLGNPRSLYVDLSVSASQSVGPDVDRFFNALTFSNQLSPQNVLAPWPTLDASLALNLGGLRVFGGFRSDVNLQSAPNLPAALAKGWSYSDTWLGESFTAWTKWYAGAALGF